MRSSSPRTAAFTPALPGLEAFLNRHIHSDHPLRHSPLWLTENEIRTHSLKLDCAALRQPAQQLPPSVRTLCPLTFTFLNMDQINPDSEICWRLQPVDVPTSLSTMRPYSGQMMSYFQELRKARGFESNWWGVAARWRSEGALMKPGAIPVTVNLTAPTSLVHISLVSNAEEILRHSYISGKTGTFCSWINAREEGSVNPFQNLLVAHMTRYGFDIPLYFAATSLQRARIGIRPGTDPLDLSSMPPVWSPFRVGEDTVSSSNTLHASTYTNRTTSYQQFYHISQVRFPNGYEVPLSVQEAEQRNPGVPINGRNGALLRHAELQLDALLHSPTPELAALIQSNGSTMGIGSEVDLASPRHVCGRSVWYLPQDVLLQGGKVDVNGAPVEVALTGLYDRGASRQMYNVKQLLVPLEGYKVVGCIPTSCNATEEEDFNLAA